MEQHDHRARLRRFPLPHGQVMAVDDDVVLDRRPRRLGLRRHRNRSDQRHAGGNRQSAIANRQ
jgi:hypothetical protein